MISVRWPYLLLFAFLLPETFLKNRLSASERSPIQLAYDAKSVQVEPSGVQLAIDRKLVDLPLSRPMLALHDSKQTLVTATGTTLRYPTTMREGLQFRGNTIIIPAGAPSEIKGGSVEFEIQFEAGERTLRSASLRIDTMPGAQQFHDWQPLQFDAPREIPAGTPLVLKLVTRVLDAKGYPIAFEKDAPTPLNVLAIWGDPRLEFKQEGPPSIFLLTFDTLRADRMGKQRDGKSITPILDALAAQGYVFTRCYSPTSWTLPAYQSLLTGLHPAQLGYGQAPARDEMEDNMAKLRYGRQDNLAHLLRSRHGARSVASTGGGMLEPWQNNFMKGFSSYWSNPSLDGTERDGQTITEARQNVDRLALEISPQGQGTIFGFYHTYECHTPYSDERYTQHLKAGRIRAPFGEGNYLPLNEGEALTDAAKGIKAMHAELTADEKIYIEALYDGDVYAADHALGRLLKVLEARGHLESSWIVFTSDHGEEFFEHGGMSHGHSLYNELLHVPLIIVPPGGLKQRVQIDLPVSLLDLFPTFCALQGLEVSANRVGRNLLPLLIEDSEARAKVALPDNPGVFVACSTFHGPSRWAIKQGHWKYIRSLEVERWARDDKNRLMMRLEPEELYDLSSDPGEQHNLFGQPQVAEVQTRLQEALALIRKRILQPLELSPGDKLQPPVVPDPALLEKLKKLGY